MLLDYLGLDAGQRIRDAVTAAFGTNVLTLDAAGSPVAGTAAVSAIVRDHL